MNAYDISENPDFKTFNIFPSPVYDNVLDYFTLAVGMHVACLYVEDGLWYLSEIIAKNDELLECQCNSLALQELVQTFKYSNRQKTGRIRHWFPQMKNCEDTRKKFNPWLFF